MYQSNIYKKNDFTRKSSSGFGLIELLVSISVMLLVTSMVMSQQNAFNGTVLLRSQAYEVALQARDTQLRAVSAIGDGTGSFREVYGLHFSSELGDNGGYKVFKDADDDLYFDAGEEFGQQGALDPRFIISEIRAVEDNGSDSVLSNVSVVFERPNFDARFYSAGGVPVASDPDLIEIDIRLKNTSGGALGEVRTMEITKAGQIAVQ